MRLGATFFRRKELVEPAVDLAKEMDCIEAAIFRVICVFKSVFMMMIWIFPRFIPFLQKRDFSPDLEMNISRVSKFKKRSRKTTISTSSRPKQALLLVSLLLVLFAVVRDRE